MRKIILDLAVTLDGFIEGPNGETDWCIVEGEPTEFLDFIDSVDAVLYGRKSYDLWGNYQPEEDAPLTLKKIFEATHSKQKYVFSETKSEDGTAAIFINDHFLENIDKLKSAAGKDIWLYGGGQLITFFINNNLVDQYQLAVHPLLLGSGKPLFHDLKERINLKLESSVAHPSGVVSLKYTVQR